VRADRTVVAPAPEQDVGTADTSLSLHQVAGKTSGRRKEPSKPADESASETMKNRPLPTAVVKRAQAPAPVVTVTAEDSTPPAPKPASKAPLAIAALLVLIISGGVAFILSGRTTETVEGVPVVDVMPATVEPLPPVPVVTPEATPTPPPPVEEPRPVEAKPRPAVAKKVPSQEALKARVNRLRETLTNSSTRLILDQKLAPKLASPMSDADRVEFARSLDELEP
jgi:hypothetical protein